MKQWINKSIFYHIYPLGFCGAPEYNDGVQSYRLDKIIDWIPHLKALNINAVYFGPVFEATKHGYDTKDYYKLLKEVYPQGVNSNNIRCFKYK